MSVPVESAQFVMTAVGVLALPALGFVYHGLIARLNDGRERMRQHGESLKQLSIGQTELGGALQAQGERLNGRIDVLSQRQADMNGRQTKAESEIDTMRAQQADSLSKLLQAMARTSEITQQMAERTEKQLEAMARARS